METIGEVKETMAVDLGSLLDAGDDAVVTLVAGDTRLVAHRAVLSARSPVFAAMFRHDTLEASSGEVAIPDVEGPVLRQLLSYLYTLKAPQLPGTAPQLLAASDKYGVSVLKAECERQVAAQLSAETAVTAALLAIRHSCPILRQAAFVYMKTHMLEVMATQGWADAVNIQPEDFVEMSRLLSETSAPAPAAVGTSPSQPHSEQAACGRSPASAAAPSAVPSRSPPLDGAAVSRLRNLSPEEKNRRLVRVAGHGTVVELEALLAAGADVGAADAFGQTALLWAAHRGREEAARRLLAAGAAVGAKERIMQHTPLHRAARNGHAAVVQLLLVAGADHGDRTGLCGWTALHCAAVGGHTEAAAALLQAGADRATRDNRGKTPLDKARQHGHRQVVQLLQSW